MSPPSPIRPGLAAEWMLRPDVAFLNHGSFGAVPRVVYEEQDRLRRRIEAEPIELLGRKWRDLLAPVKARLAAFLRADPDDLGLVTNATQGVNAVLRSIELSSKQELLTTDHVYHAVRQAMKHVASRAGADYREVAIPVPVPSADDVFGRVMEAVTSRTRLVVIDHVTSPTALVFPAERIARACAERGVEVLIDGAHAPGMFGLDVPATGATYYAGNLHKWCCAPKGSAFLWCRPDRKLAVHPPTISHYLGESFAAEFSWQGTFDASAWLAIPAALDFMERLGWERVRAYNRALAAWAQRHLARRWGTTPLGPPDGSMLGSMATVPPPQPIASLNSAAWERAQQRLYDRHKVEAPLPLWNGRVWARVSCQAYNDASQVEELADAVEALARDAHSL